MCGYSEGDRSVKSLKKMKSKRFVRGIRVANARTLSRCAHI